jgi:ATP-dependent DNA helicase RecQ
VVINRFLLDSREPNPELTAEDNQAVREQDEKRLQTMIYYCQTTNCLRDYILKYFGEYGNNGNCSNCSSCNNEFEQVDVTDAALKIISCVREVRSRYGINVIAGILAGSDRAKLREYHVEVFEAFGALKEKSEPEIKRIIQFLLLEGYLEVTNDKYALIHLTEKSGLVAEEEKLVMKLPKLSVNKVTSKSAEKTSVKSFRKSDILNTRGMDLFEKLRALRMQIAKNENIPPYIVFSDKTLMDMCVKLPLTEEEMFTVNGVGQRKFDSYGVQFMQVIREFTGGSDEKLYFGDEQEVISPKKDSRKIPKAEFYLTKQQAEEFPYAEKYLVTEIAEKLSNLRDADTVKKVTGADIFRMMQAEGYASEGYVDGMRRKSVSPSGQEAGLFIGMRMSRKGTEYEDIYYSEKAQRMIVSRYIKREP